MLSKIAKFSDNVWNQIVSHLMANAWISMRVASFVGAKRRSLSGDAQFGKLQRYAQTAIALIILLVFFWFFSVRIGHYFSWPQSAYLRPELYNLTAELVKWDVYYGSSPKCGELDCHLTASYPENQFLKQMVLPAREFPLKQFKKGQTIYLRGHIEVPQHLLSQPETIMLHTLYIWAEHFEFYINGTLISEGGSQLLNLPIPRSYINSDHTVDLAFKIDAGNLPTQGLSNNAYLVLGPASLLQSLAFAADELKTTYYLWFLLPTITFAIVFVFLFLLVTRNPGDFLFIGYALFTAATIFLYSGFPKIMIPIEFDWRTASEVLQVVANMFLLMFLHEYFHGKQNRNTFVLIGVTLIAAILMFLLKDLVNPSIASRVRNLSDLFTRAGAVYYGFYLCSLTVLEQSNQQKTFTWNDKSQLFFFYGASAIFVSIWFGIRFANEFFGESLVPLYIYKFSMNLMKVFDLGFFVSLAAINATGIGISFARKETIEKELQAAASIAQAFAPDPLPQWSGFTVNAFYRPYSDGSGDWFAFVESSSGRFRHFILCDITGHGIQAALVVSSAKTVLSQFVAANPEAVDSEIFLEHYIHDLNRVLFEQGKGHHTLTLLGLTFSERKLTHISAGHPSPIMVLGGASEEIQIKPLVSRAGIVGANHQMSKIAMQHTPVPTKCQILTYTDGLPLKISGASLKRNFLSSMVQNVTLDASALFKAVWAEERERTGRRPDDDTSIVIFSIDTE